MDSIFEEMSLVFDEKNNTIISKDKLLAITKQLMRKSMFLESDSLPSECYVLIDSNLKDFYPFPVEELKEWEKDGSLERGDILYKMQLLKKY